MLSRVTVSLLSVYLFCALCEDVPVSPEQTDVMLTCHIPNPIWKKNNKTITDKDKDYIIVPENGTLCIKKIDHSHMGMYVCTDDKNSSLTINVYVSPYVKPFEKTKNMIQDDPLQLECKGYGNPDPVVEWYFGDKLKTMDDDRVTLKDTQPSSDSGLMINGTIRIKTMTFEDAGNYVCIATNIYGSSNATIKVQVKDKLAALWPFLGICAEVAILCTIIFIYEKRRAKKMQEEEDKTTEEAEGLNANNETKGNDDVRQRK